MTELTATELADLRAELERAGVQVVGRLEARLIAGGRSNLTFALSDSEHRWVLRCPPRVGRTPSAHDVAREFRVTRALEDTDVPVARTVHLCEDESILGGPFTVVDFVDGRSVRTQDELDELGEDGIALCVTGLLTTFARLHAVDPDAVGLTGFGRPNDYAARQLRRWSGQWEIVGTHADPATTRLEAELVDRLRAGVPPQPHSSIVHGDYRIDNTLIDRDDAGRVRAVVDWELSTLGDPVADVAMMCCYRHPALDLLLGVKAAWTSDRLPSVPELAAGYEAVAPISLDHWDFHMAAGFYKLAVISQGIDHRYRAGAASGAGYDTAGSAVAEFLAAGLGWVGAR